MTCDRKHNAPTTVKRWPDIPLSSMKNEYFCGGMKPAMTSGPESKPRMSQLDKFKDTARELECDDDEKRFKERLGKLAKQKSEQPK